MRFDFIKDIPVTDREGYAWHVGALAFYGLTSCSEGLQSMMALKFVGRKNSRNGYVILQVVAGVGSLVIPFLNGYLLSRFELEMSFIFYLGGAAMGSMSLLLMVMGCFA